MNTDTSLNPTPLPISYIGTLQEALKFSDADAALNRTGTISSAQKKKLERAWSRLLIGGLIGIAAVTIAATFAFFMAQRQSSFILQAAGIALTFFNAFIVIRLAQSRIRLNTDINGAVTRTEGIVRHTVRISGRTARYLLEVNGERMLVEKPVFFAFEDNRRYALYRTAASKTLISAEKLEL